MSRCQAMRGFLALRRCDGPAVATCASCGRGVCGAHVVGSRCTECSDAGEDWRTDPQGPSRYRRRFHEEGGWTGGGDSWGYGRYGFTGASGVDETVSEGSGWDS